MIGEYEEKSPPTLDKPVVASGEAIVDPFMEKGTSGSIYVYYKLYQFFKANKDNKKVMKEDSKYSPNYFMNKAIKALETNFKLVEQEEKKSKKKRPSFL